MKELLLEKYQGPFLPERDYDREADEAAYERGVEQ